jgi:hypothetical protein
MRLHSGILAAVAGTPAVVIDYDPKTRAFATQTKQTRWTITIDELESRPAAVIAGTPQVPADNAAAPGAARLCEAIMETAAHRGERRAALARAVAPLRVQTGQTAQMAVQLASGGRV